MATNQYTIAAYLSFLFAAVLGVPFDTLAASIDENAKQILEATGIQGGLIVHIGCGDGKLTAALQASPRYQVQGIDRDASNVAASREHLKAAGNYGEISVDHWPGDHLPYVDNLANLVVAEEPAGVSPDEIMRVLAPGGAAYVKQDGKWQKTVKPRPDSIDEWTHYLHDASGNAVAHDDVGPPRHLQWIGSPRWSRHHDRMASMSALVSAGGRVFYIMDEGSRVSIQLPPKWKVIARDAFNGTILWKRSIAEWHNHLWPLKSGPTQLARRLVAVGDEVYVTLGLEAPVTALDAATGETLRTYANTKSTEEFLVADTILAEGGAKQRVLFALVTDQPLRLSEYAPQLNVGDQARVRKEFLWNEKPRRVVALHAQSGRVLWSKETTMAPLTLTSGQNRVVFHDGQKVVCLDASTGDELWTSQPALRRKTIPFNFGPKIVIYQNVVLFAGGDRQMAGLSLETGEELWAATHDKSAYESPEDLLVTGGLVWSAPTTRTQDTGVFTGRDPRTGEVKKQFPPTVDTYWFHHRCYIAKATDRFLLPSRTGIEFVDYDTEQWDINHWVRGGCLYGIMPCNGLVYAPPHDCACYPEAKLFGLNALAPTSPTRIRSEPSSDENRWQRGPAFASQADGQAIRRAESEQWPTYRRDASRSGHLQTQIPAKIEKAWKTELGGRLSSVVVADGKVLVAQVDQHTLHALNEKTGEAAWSYTTGGRIDSPPTVDGGRVFFGSADGWVYCLRSSDGELAWRFRAAPSDQRLMAFEQLESVWPVHGNVLVENGTVHCVAGRSNFLDGGLRFLRLDAKTGRKISETIIDEKDPTTGENLQARLQVLNMPVGLPDILSSDGKFIYMRSQQFDREGNRLELGPHSGDSREQGSVQRGEAAHLFSPTGFLDGTWFHRSYWVYGRSFAGGHSGYHQAGKYTPGGRLMVFDDDHVYGFGRKSQYYKWTTTMEHQLFASSKEPPEIDPALARRGRSGTMIQFENTAALNPTGQPVTVEMWVKAEKNKNGVLLARGGPTHGFSLYVDKGRPHFAVRKDGEVLAASGVKTIVGRWSHVVGALTDDKLNLYINGQLVASTESAGLLAADPAQGMEIGADDAGAVGTYSSPFPFTGLMDEVRLYYGSVTTDDIVQRYQQPERELSEKAGLVLACTFDRGDTKDTSGHNHHGVASAVRPANGKVGGGMRFRGFTGASGSFVKHDWATDLPLLVRAMVLTGGNLFVAGPPDIVDEEESFSRLVNRDKLIEAQLVEQDLALEGAKGGLLQVVSTDDGRTVAEYQLDELPVWDGMAATSAGIFLATEDGSVLSFTASR